MSFCCDSAEGRLGPPYFVGSEKLHDCWNNQFFIRTLFFRTNHAIPIKEIKQKTRLAEKMNTETGLTIWTIGHSTRPFDEFLQLLTTNDIEALADVRRYPNSRRYPHFNQAALAESLPEHGIEYISFPELGGRRRPRPDSQNLNWHNESFRGYADY